MNLYLDTSAIVKRYVAEPGSTESVALTANADLVATSLISGAEVAAALARAVRLGAVSLALGEQARKDFLGHWLAFERIPVSVTTINLAGKMAWEHVLRGYDAVHLASALVWQDDIGRPVTLGTYDRELWLAAGEVGLEPWPARLPR